MKKWGIALALVFTVIVGKNFYEGRKAFLLAEEKYAQGEMEKTITLLDQSIHWYFPGNSYVHKAIEKLWGIGQEVEQKNPKIALRAYDSIRGGIYAIRSLYSPYSEWLPKVNERIAFLRTEESMKENPKLNRSEILALHQKLLLIDERPKKIWSLWASIAFLGWIFSVVGWIWKGFDPAGVMNIRRSIPWIFGILICFSGWIIGLLNA